MRRAAIEDASVKMLEVFERVSAEAKKEKKAIPPVNKLVYYWTRKPLIVGRAVALASTLERPDDVEKLLELEHGKRAYQMAPNLKEYRALLGMDPSEITMLDPFAGTGNLALPSVELGLDVTCSDYNPLAYLIERGSLEIPARAAPGLAQEFKEAADQIIDEVEEEVGKFYEPGKLAYFWAWCIRCVHCNQRIPLLNQMYLSTKKKIGLRFTPTQDRNFSVEIVRNISDSDGRLFTQRMGRATCFSCGNTTDYEAMTQDIAKNKDIEMLAIQKQNLRRGGRDYILPEESDGRQYTDSLQYLDTPIHPETDDKHTKFIPHEEIYKDPRNPLSNYGIENWNEFFSGRQLLILSTLVEKINSFCEKPENSGNDDLRVYLSFLVALFVNIYSYGVYWNSSGDKPEPTFALRQPRIVFNLAEINPFEKVRGSLRNNVKNIVKGIEFCSSLRNPVRCRMESVTAPSDTKYDLIITDPPYGNDVQYGELSEFLYLWMYRILRGKTLPPRVPLDEDFCESQGRFFGDRKLASEFFDRGLKKSFLSINGKLKDDGLLVVFFAHSSIRAWNQLLTSLRDGGFRVVSSYALHTESTSNPLARGKTSFMSSIVVACRKRTERSSGFMEDIIPDTEDGIKEILEKIPTDRLLTLPMTDLLIMVYGKVLETCTRYETLKSRSGDTKPDFEMLLSNAQSAVMRLLVQQLTKSSMNTVGPRMAFYILIKVFQKGMVSADDMLKITKAYNTKPETLEKSGIIARNGSVHRLVHIHENEMDFPPENVERDNLHQQLCYLARMVDTGRSNTVDDTLDRENFRRTTLKQIVQLILKSLNMRRNRGDSLDADEKDEMKILETLADIMGVRSEGGMDAFMWR